MAERDEWDDEAPEMGSSQWAIWLAVIILMGAAGLIILKKMQSPERPVIPEETSEPETPEKKQLTRADLEQLVQQAGQDYRKFNEAERAGENALRTRYLNEAKVKLQTFMDHANKMELSGSDDEILMKRATELLFDLNKRTRTGD